MKLTRSHIIFGVLIAGVTYNFFVYTNLLFVFMITCYLLVYYYTNPITSVDKNDKLRKMIESFEVNAQPSKVYCVYERPKKYKYIFVKRDIQNYLYALRFLRKYNRALYEELFMINEKFLKIYYNSIVARYDAKTNIVILKDLYMTTRELKDQCKFSIPRSLQNTCNTEFMNILKYMKHRLNICAALIEGKIK